MYKYQERILILTNFIYKERTKGTGNKDEKKKIDYVMNYPYKGIQIEQDSEKQRSTMHINNTTFISSEWTQ